VSPVPDQPRRGLLDTNVIILRRSIDVDQLPDEVAISAVTLAELSAGVHLVAESDVAGGAERARRMEVLQRTEAEFDPLPFDADAARVFGRISAAVAAAGRTPRRRLADLMIASIAAANGLPLYTTNPSDYVGLGAIVEIVPVVRPTVT
jgi:predicted nucleic acid-binding protein